MIGLLIAILLWAVEAQATIYFDETFEGINVNTTMTDNLANGVVWDYDQGTPSPTLVVNTVKATVTPPNGSRYLEAHGLCTTYVSNRCTVGATTNAGVQLSNSGGGITATTLADGTTYYLGMFVRYERISSRDIFDDTGSPDSWNKTFEFAGTGTRWGIGIGWPSGNYTATNGKFTADLWCSNAAFPTWCVTDHPLQNQNGYGASTPYLMDYERWYAVVMGVTTSTSAVTGRLRLWVNGTLIMDRNQQTMNSGAGYDHHWIQSTFGQPAYDNPEALYQMDYLIFTDSLTDITNAGLMSDPSEGSGGGSSIVLFIEQSTMTILGALQYLACLVFLWERRAKAAQLATAVHDAYWTFRYRQAVRRWQKRAPLMLQHRNTIILEKQEYPEWLKRP